MWQNLAEFGTIAEIWQNLETWQNLAENRYCVYATNSLKINLTLECTLAFFLELLQCQNINHVMWSRDHKARLVNLTLEQPLTSRQQSITNFNTAYVPLQVIFVYVDKASIPTVYNNIIQVCHNKIV